MTPIRPTSTLLCCVMIVSHLSGCVSSRPTLEPIRNFAHLDEVSFLHALAARPLVTVDEGMRAILLLEDVTARGLTFQERSTALQRLGAVKIAWRLQSDHILDKGTLAYMLRTICRLRPSLNELIARKTGLGERRYALAVCIHEKLMRHSLAHEPVTGGELLSALTATERYLSAAGGDIP